MARSGNAHDYEDAARDVAQIRWVKLEALGTVQRFPVWKGGEGSIVAAAAAARLKNFTHVLFSSCSGGVANCLEHLGNGGDDATLMGSNCGGKFARGTFARISNVFKRRPRQTQKKGDEQEAARITGRSVVYAPHRGTYAYDILQRLFKEFDKDCFGYITENDFKVALKRLNLPVSELDLQDFRSWVMETTNSDRITFEQFANLAIKRENFLFDTFKELDRTKTGYISAEEMKTALRKYKFRLSDAEVSKMISELTTRSISFGSLEFYNGIPTFDFDNFRNILMVSTTKDTRDAFDIWGRSIIDLGDIDTTLPISNERCNKSGRLWHRRPKDHTIQHMMTGAIASAISRTILAPLERFRIISMVNPEVANQGFMVLLRRCMREEGIRGAFKGNLLDVLRIAPSKAIGLFVYENLKELILKRKEQINMSGTEQIILGTLASMAGAIVAYPLDTMRSVLAVQIGNSSIRQPEGKVHLFRGLGHNVLRVAAYSALNFYIYDELTERYRRKIGPGGELGTLPKVLFGALAGAAAHTVVYPLEVLQRRMQVHIATDGSTILNNWVAAFQNILWKKGANDLYAGILLTYIKVIPAAAISFLVYQRLSSNQRFQMDVALKN